MLPILPVLHHNGNTDFYITLKYISTLSDKLFIVGKTEEIVEKCKELKLNILEDFTNEEYEYILYLHSGDNIYGGDLKKEIKVAKDVDVIYIYSSIYTNKNTFFKVPILYKKNTPFFPSFQECKSYTMSFDFSMNLSASTLESQIIYLSTKEKNEYYSFLIEFYKYILTGDKINLQDVKYEEFVSEIYYQNKQYLEAFVKSKKISPLLRLAEEYMEKKDPITAYMFSYMSLELEDSTIYYFNNREDYSRTRYILFAEICLLLGKIEDGNIALIKGNIEDTNDIKKKYLEIQDKNSIKTKKQFFNIKMDEYVKLYPNLNSKQLLSKIKKEWSKRK